MSIYGALDRKYKDESLKEIWKPVEDYIENYEKENELLFAKTLCDFGICLGCGYTIWNAHCGSFLASEIILFET